MCQENEDYVNKNTLNKPLLGIDYGEKCIGLASVNYFSFPHPMPWGKILGEKLQDDTLILKEIKQVVDDELVEGIVVGVPHYLNGDLSDFSKKVMEWGKNLSKKLKIPVYFQDETLTTFEAKERMKKDPRYNFQINPKKLDALCASIILEDFIKRCISTR